MSFPKAPSLLILVLAWTGHIALISRGAEAADDSIGEDSPYVCAMCEGGEKARAVLDETHPHHALCLDLDLSASLYDNNETECRNTVQNAAFLCECPGTIDSPVCTLCGGGGDETDRPANSDAVIPESNTTCAVFELFVKEAADETACQIIQMSYIPSFCGCPRAPPLEEFTCSSVCTDGKDVGNPDAALTWDGQETTCLELDQSLSASPFFRGPQCDAVSYLGVKICGCDGPYDYTCDVCTGGSLPPLQGVMPGGMSCQEVAGLVSQNDEFLCAGAQATVGKYCGCPGNDAIDPPCPLCGPGMDLPEPFRRIPTFEDEFTCGDIEYVLNTELFDSCEEERLPYQQACCSERSEIPSVMPSHIPSSFPSVMPSMDVFDDDDDTTTTSSTPPPTTAPATTPDAGGEEGEEKDGPTSDAGRSPFPHHHLLLLVATIVVGNALLVSTLGI